jgi:hypothetical protein
MLALLLACTPKDDPGIPDKSTPPARSEVGDPGELVAGNEVGGGTARVETDAGMGGAVTLHVVNVSAYDVCWVYADECAGAQSADLLGSDSLPAGAYLNVTGLPAGCLALYAYDCDHKAAWYTQAEVTGETTWMLSREVEGGGDDTGAFTL